MFLFLSSFLYLFLFSPPHPFDLLQSQAAAEGLVSELEEYITESFVSLSAVNPPSFWMVRWKVTQCEINHRNTLLPWSPSERVVGHRVGRG